MNTAENNKIIAEFMNLEIISSTESITTIVDNEILKVYNPNSNWNLLMEVVYKCLTICNEEMLNEWEAGFSDSFFSMDINCMYAETVRFIKWYNENSAKEN